MPSAPLAPNCLCLLICDNVVVDETSKAPSIFNVINTLMVQDVPGIFPRLAMFATLIDGRGTVEMEFRIVRRGENIDEPHVVSSVRLQAGISDPLIPFDVHIKIHNVLFREFGTYHVEFLAQGDLIASRQFEVKKLERASQAI